MIKIFNADKDTYITNRVIGNVIKSGSNVGSAGTLDLFKLYSEKNGYELSRLLLHFDLTNVDTTQFNINNNFKSYLKLYDVYGGQTCPRNFTTTVYPLSRSFDEGLGRDIVFYGDYDAANFVQNSVSENWILSGCNASGSNNENVDYIISSSAVNDYSCTQYFTTGEENLLIDVTKIVSGILTNDIPNSGFRLSLGEIEESDQHNYFVKRFASRTAYNGDLHPKLYIQWNDAVRNDINNVKFDVINTLYFYNYDGDGNLTNTFGNDTLTGSNCLTLKFDMPISGGMYTLLFSGSQFNDGINERIGIYTSSFIIEKTEQLKTLQQISGSIKMLPIWCSNDQAITYLSGTNVTINDNQRSNSQIDMSKYVVSVYSLNEQYDSDCDDVEVRVHIVDKNIMSNLAKTYINDPGISPIAHYRIRNVYTNDIIIPFDFVNNSTLMSTDVNGNYFMFSPASLPKDNVYTIDVAILCGAMQKTFNDCSTFFKVSDKH